MSLPTYKCHKTVRAGKISKIDYDYEAATKENRESDGSAILHFHDENIDPIKVNREYVKKRNPIVGGYYVLYEDGFESFSPFVAFESGYTLIEDDQPFGFKIVQQDPDVLSFDGTPIPKMYTEASIHFTIKGQTIEEIEGAFNEWYMNQTIVDFGTGYTRLNHCFLTREQVTERGFDTGVVDMLDKLAVNQTRWMDEHSLEEAPIQRTAMMKHMEESNGVAIFVGAIIEGVKDELLLCDNIMRVNIGIPE